jgi:hypothetical protein
LHASVRHEIIPIGWTPAISKHPKSRDAVQFHHIHLALSLDNGRRYRAGRRRRDRICVLNDLVCLSIALNGWLSGATAGDDRDRGTNRQYMQDIVEQSHGTFIALG